MKKNNLSLKKSAKSLLAKTIDSIKRESQKNTFSGIMDNELFEEDLRTSPNKNLILTQKNNRNNSLKYTRNKKIKNKKLECKKEIIQSLKEENVNKGNYIKLFLYNFI